MGSGKSYWCKKISKKLKTRAYDLDALIEAAEEKTVSEIFAEDGEEYFRKAEARLLRWFGQKKAFVLATGGGTPCFNDNMQWMNKNGITVWIDESVDVLVERLQTEKAHRPLIKDLSNEQLNNYLIQKLQERQTFYSNATYHLKGKQISDHSFAEIINKHA
jgi:shikimate kinase